MKTPLKFDEIIWGTQGVIVIIIGNGHPDPSSNPGWGCLHFT